MTPVGASMALSRSIERLEGEKQSYGLAHLLTVPRSQEREPLDSPYTNRKRNAALTTSVPTVRSDEDAADLWRQIEIKRRLQLERLE